MATRGVVGPPALAPFRETAFPREKNFDQIYDYFFVRLSFCSFCSKCFERQLKSSQQRRLTFQVALLVTKNRSGTRKAEMINYSRRSQLISDCWKLKSSLMNFVLIETGQVPEAKSI